MKTSDLLKQIHKELQEELSKNKNKPFLKEYFIPTINYHKEDSTLEDHYFASGIEMELAMIIDSLDNEIYFTTCKDKYFFSNKLSLVNKKMIEAVEDIER